MAPAAGTSLPPVLPRDHIDELQRLRQLLHLLFHRNKNQHHSSIWWRFFAGFRREIARFLDETDLVARVDAVIVPSKPQKQERKRVRERMEMRARLWRDTLVERWYLAFSQLIASTQFFPIGLVLLASLARVCQILGITTSYAELEGPRVQDVARRIEKKELVDPADVSAIRVGDEDQMDVDQDPMDTAAGREDVGEVVLRNAVEADEGESVETTPRKDKKDKLNRKKDRKPVDEASTGRPQDREDVEGSGPTPASRRSKKADKEDRAKSEKPKKKRKKNAIDDIFGF